MYTVYLFITESQTLTTIPGDTAGTQYMVTELK